ncbi:MAG: class I SAM-dependent methyltransferase [Clostridia bacterium]|nr:class I SAM-dependent methyltransferase [Clostridia bacterium]
MREVIEHYNKLIDENNDPARDPKPLRDYMDKWDGEKFIESMQLDKGKSVLEIGIGTGRIAIKVAPYCKSLCGIDISEKTIGRAKENLSMYQNINLICCDFMSCEFETQFDVIYSSLTFHGQ